jgi:hypothetical protein
MDALVILLLAFVIIALIALFDLNKRVHELEEKFKALLEAITIVDGNDDSLQHAAKKEGE